MRVSKLPDNMNYNEKIENKVREEYRKCPFCGNDKKYIFYDNGYHSSNEDGYSKKGVRCRKEYGRYGYGKPWYKHLFEGSSHWYYFEYECYACGAEWESDEFPDMEFKPRGKRLNAIEELSKKEQENVK